MTTVAQSRSELHHQAREVVAPYAALVDEWHNYAAKLELVYGSQSVTENERAMAGEELAALRDKVSGVHDEFVAGLPGELQEQSPVRNLTAALERLAKRLQLARL
jgi:predicted nuclease with TOPRIM domain